MLYGSTILFAIICLGGAIGYVFASSRATGEVLMPKALAKGVASSSFVVLAYINGALASPYGRAIFVALVLSWLGDMLLLSRQGTYLLAGIAAFLFAHIAFIAAFALQDLSVPIVAAGLVITGMPAILILKWLWKRLVGLFAVAVPVYLAVIMAMVSTAVAATFAAVPITVALAALFFAASDVSVARDRFVERDVLNKAWGLPLYYLAQILFATSVLR